MDIGQKRSMMRLRWKDGRIIPSVDTIGRIYNRISSSPIRFIYTLAKEKSGYEGFEDLEMDKKLKTMTDEELLEELKEFSVISYKNLNKFQSVLSGLFGFLLSVEGYQYVEKTKDEQFKIAQYIFDKSMFLLGFKKSDYEIKWVHYTDSKTDEIKEAWGVEIKNIVHFKNCLDEYKNLNKDKLYKNREIKHIEQEINKLSKGEKNVSLYWQRKKIMKKIYNILISLKKVKELELNHKSLSERIHILNDHSMVLNQTVQNIEIMQNYLFEIKESLEKNKSGNISLSNLIKNIEYFQLNLKNHKKQII